MINIFSIYNAFKIKKKRTNNLENFNLKFNFSNVHQVSMKIKFKVETTMVNNKPVNAITGSNSTQYCNKSPVKSNFRVEFSYRHT